MSVHVCVLVFFFFFKQKTAYEMRISDWSSDVCSSDLREDRMDDHRRRQQVQPESNVRAAGDTCRIRRVPAHREQKYADAEQQDEAEDEVLVDRKSAV